MRRSPGFATSDSSTSIAIGNGASSRSSAARSRARVAVRLRFLRPVREVVEFMWTDSIRHLSSDARLLFATRFIRLFAYGALSVVLVLYLVGLGLSESETGLLLTSTLLGDTLVSLYLTTQADRIGRRRMLIVGAGLMGAAGVQLALRPL